MTKFIALIEIAQTQIYIARTSQILELEDMLEEMVVTQAVVLPDIIVILEHLFTIIETF